MASGGVTANLAAATLTKIYTNASTMVATVNVSFCNTSATATAIRLAISQQTLAANVPQADYVEYGQPLGGNLPYVRRGFALANGESIYAYDTNGTCSVRADVFEGTD